jgi:hypothetical protein
MFFSRECLTSGLEDEIHAHILMAHPQSRVEATKIDKEAKQVVSYQTRKPSFIPRPKPITPPPPSTPLKIHKLTWIEMVERQLKGLCYNCDEKYFPGHKCKEQNIFMAISKDVSEEDVEALVVVESPEPIDMTQPFDPLKVELIISMNSLTGFSAPQTLKLIGYIKHRKVIILVDSGSSHNFLHHHIAKETNCYIREVNNFQIMIANGESMKCGRRCENVHLQIGQNHMKSHMFSIDMGGCDIVLGFEWLRNMGPILMNFKELTMQFNQEGQQYKFQGITTGSPELISSHCMEKLLKKGNYGIIVQLHSIHTTETPFVPLDLQSILSKHQVVFSTPRAFLLPMVFMIIPFPLSLESFLPMSVPIVFPFPIKMKLRIFFKNFLPQALSVQVLAHIILPWSWYLRKKDLGTCVLTFVPSTNSSSKTNFSFLSLMISWMN